MPVYLDYANVHLENDRTYAVAVGSWKENVLPTAWKEVMMCDIKKMQVEEVGGYPACHLQLE